jgi:hypothetical protein
MIFENPRWFYHFNFTAKQHANGGISRKLFFAEVSHTQGQKAWGINCCGIINIEKKDGIDTLFTNWLLHAYSQLETRASPTALSCWRRLQPCWRRLSQ